MSGVDSVGRQRAFVNNSLNDEQRSDGLPIVISDNLSEDYVAGKHELESQGGGV